MFKDLYTKLNVTSPVAIIIVSLSLMLISGFFMTRITKLLRLPNVTAYIATGILLGPYCFGLVPENVIEGSAFLSDIALAFIAFSTGEFFTLKSLRKNGAKNMIITVFESLTASVAVFVTSYFILRLDLAFSLVISALAAATAPASTVMTIRQTGAKGDFVDTLLQVVALDDIVGLVAYSMAISVALALSSGSFGLANVLKPIGINLAALILGGAFGFLMKCLMPKKRSTDNRLIISIALLFAFCGICALAGVSPLLGCMAIGTAYINPTGDDKLFKQLNYFSPPILLLFFVRSGLNFKLDSLVGNSAIGAVPLVVVGVVYFAARIAGKYGGAFAGCAIVKKDKKVRNNLGLALIPQAGVAIGLAALGARTLGGASGEALETIILASSVLYELVGPALAKLSLYLSGSYSNKIEEIVEIPQGEGKLSDVDLLIRRIQEIQKEIPAREEKNAEDEKAFSEAAEEQYLAVRDKIKKFGGKK